MPGQMTQNSRDRKNLRKELYLKKKRGSDGKFKEDMPEGILLEKWPKFLDLQVKLPEPGETDTLHSGKAGRLIPISLSAPSSHTRACPAFHCRASPLPRPSLPPARV